MESEGLKIFLATVGDAVHSVNTICVGLAGVASGSARKPDDLTIGWASTNPEVAAARARAFALKGALVLVEEALLTYLRFLDACSNQSHQVKAALSADGAAQRIEGVGHFVKEAPQYWLPLVVLLVRWRNKVVHNSKTSICAEHRDVLVRNEAVIAESHAGIDITLTLANFDSGKITLKDFTTMMAVAIRFVRQLDDTLVPKLSSVEDFKARLLDRGLYPVWCKVSATNGYKTRERKIRAFVNTEFPSLDPDICEEIISKPDRV